MRGADKLLEPVDGAPLIATLAARIIGAGITPCAVTLSPDRPLRAAALEGSGAIALMIPDASEGMSASLRRAALWAVALGLGGLMVVPADMPELTGADFAKLQSAFAAAPTQPLRATGADGTPGHPVIFPAAFFAALTRLTGDEGARGILATFPPRRIALPARHALTDLDSPEDWANWRARPI